MANPLTNQMVWGQTLTPAPIPKKMDIEDWRILQHVADMLPQPYRRSVYQVSGAQEKTRDALRRAGLIK